MKQYNGSTTVRELLKDNTMEETLYIIKNFYKLKLQSLLQEILDANASTARELDMKSWQSECGSACCACGDVALARGGVVSLERRASDFSRELQDAADKLDMQDLVRSVWACDRSARSHFAKRSSKILQLDHLHLTEDHNDRKILHSYVELVMKEVMR